MGQKDHIIDQKWLKMNKFLDCKSTPPPWNFSTNSSNLVAGPFPYVVLYYTLQ